jgi:Zn-dependent peptidase ImmA (M78 family)
MRASISEPSGRKIFTLVLLVVLIAQGTFAPVSYGGHTKDESSPRAYELAAEVLMPAVELRAMNFPDLESVKDAADMFMVTPSAVAMRARRLGRLDRDTFGMYMDALELEYNNRPKQSMSSPRPVKCAQKVQRH